MRGFDDRHGFAVLGAELWLVRGLGDPSILEGITTPEIRRDRMRATILARGLADEVAGGRKAGKPQTWRSLFERVYLEPLTTGDQSHATDETPLQNRLID